MTAARWRSVFLGSAGVLAALALLVYFRGSLPGEPAVYDAVLAWASPAAVSVFHKINYLGDKFVILPATLLLLWVAPRTDRRRWWLWVGVMIAAPILEWLGKELIGRPRPEGKSLGFPSGHATAAAAYFFLAAYLIGKRLDRPGARVVLLWIGAGILVVLVGVARIVLQAHWPGDALAGAVLGLACVSLAAWYDERSR